MKQLSIVAVLFLVCASSSAAVLIPPELVGIWATDGSQFRGEALMKGSALYLDTDGIGAMVGGDGAEVLGELKKQGFKGICAVECIGKTGDDLIDSFTRSVNGLSEIVAELSGAR